jgi:hypothetical protein
MIEPRRRTGIAYLQRAEALELAPDGASAPLDNEALARGHPPSPKERTMRTLPRSAAGGGSRPDQAAICRDLTARSRALRQLRERGIALGTPCDCPTCAPWLYRREERRP